ncbi:hypothetical protein SNEBB_009862 [Seison nebaliae]|nr:hypothetical protein SNEBB_009862 [Seison nebaliae]
MIETSTIEHRLKLLKQKRIEASKQNQAEVIKELSLQKRKKHHANNSEEMNPNDILTRKDEAMKDWKKEEELYVKDANVNGMSVVDVKQLDKRADELDKEANRRKRKAGSGSKPFSSYEDATARSYVRLTKKLHPDLAAYQQQKNELGEMMYRKANDLGHGTHQPTEAAIDRMANDVQKQAEKRQTYTRRRRTNPDADITSINERNDRFNKKLEHTYNKYTSEIREALERGTAI